MSSQSTTVTVRKTDFLASGLKIVGNLYLPPSSAPDRKGAALAVLHPFTGVKEQTAGKHAKALAEVGFITLAFDSAYQGESEGEPRGLDSPYRRAEETKCCITYLSTLPEVDAERIGVLGICVGGSIALFATASDLRVKSVAAVSTVDPGRITREGILGTPQTMSSAILEGLLKQTGQDRIHLMKNPSDVPQGNLFPAEASPANTSPSFLEGPDYYKTERGSHPRSTGLFPRHCYDIFATFDPFHFNHMISPRPLLVIHGKDADTRIFSEDAVHRAREPKELYLVPDANHFTLYDHLDRHLEKLIVFFADSLCI